MKVEEPAEPVFLISCHGSEKCAALESLLNFSDRAGRRPDFLTRCAELLATAVTHHAISSHSL